MFKVDRKFSRKYIDEFDIFQRPKFVNIYKLYFNASTRV